MTNQYNTCFHCKGLQVIYDYHWAHAFLSYTCQIVVINCHVVCSFNCYWARKFVHCDRHCCLYGQQHQSHDGHLLPAANGLVGAGFLHFWILLGHQYDSLETRLDFPVDANWSFRFVKYDLGSQWPPQELSFVLDGCVFKNLFAGSHGDIHCFLLELLFPPALAPVELWIQQFFLWEHRTRFYR